MARWCEFVGFVHCNPLSIPLPSPRLSFPLHSVVAIPGIQAEMTLTGSHVVPVRVIWGKLLLGSGLNGVDPCRDLELSRTLKVGRVGFDERLGAVGVGRKVKRKSSGRLMKR